MRGGCWASSPLWRGLRETEQSMSNLLKLAEQIRHEIDRELGSRLPQADEALANHDSPVWQSGERDFLAVSAGVPTGDSRTAVEIGCRHGRMLRAAARRFGRVVGVDLSERAVNRARQALGADARVELMVSSDLGLAPIADGSADFVWSFSAISTMPPLAVAALLRESRRILKAGGTMRLRMLFGRDVEVFGEGIMHPRAYRRDAFERAARLAGFEVIDVSAALPTVAGPLASRGVEAMAISLQPTVPAASAEAIADALSAGASGARAAAALPDIEALATIDFAASLADQGERERAREVLQYVELCCRTATIDIRDILERVVARTAPKVSAESRGASPVLESNLRILKERFPEAHQRVAALRDVDTSSAHVTETSQGPAVWREGSCLDHAEKPRQAAAAWVARALQDRRVSEAANIVVLGFGGGYHLEELQAAPGTRRVWCCEPSAPALRAALASRDLTGCLQKLSGLSIGEPDVASIEGGIELLVRPQNALLDSGIVQPLRTKLVSRRGLSLLHPRIAVLGPLQGGTIPTGHYTQAALQRFGQHSRGIDMSGFNKGYELLDELARSERGRAVARNSYVEMLTATMLQNFEEKPIDVLICMAQAPASAKFLDEMRRRGVVTVLWFVEDYLRFTYWRDMARHYDFVFTIQKDGCLEAIKAAGAGEVHYLPTACDPFLHRPLELSAEEREAWGSQISFVGAGYHNRQQMFASLGHYPFKIWGSEWPTCKPFDAMVQENARRISPEEYVKIFNASDINLNLHSSTERDGVEPNGDFVNPRTFELASCGAFQLVDERTLLGECFEAGKEIVTFSSLPDLVEKIEHYKSRPEERAAIAAAGRARALRDHSYDRRIEQMLSIIYASKFQHLAARESESPWAKMIERSGSQEELRGRCEKARARGEQPTLDALVSDVVTGNGKLTETEQKLMFLFHVKKHILRPALGKTEEK